MSPPSWLSGGARVLPWWERGCSQSGQGGTQSATQQGVFAPLAERGGLPPCPRHSNYSTTAIKLNHRSHQLLSLSKSNTWVNRQCEYVGRSRFGFGEVAKLATELGVTRL